MDFNVSCCHNTNKCYSSYLLTSLLTIEAVATESAAQNPIITSNDNPICHQKYFTIECAICLSVIFCILGRMNGKHQYQKNNVEIVQDSVFGSKFLYGRTQVLTQKVDIRYPIDMVVPFHPVVNLGQLGCLSNVKC